jgi:predicted transcriptional regulator
MESKIVLLSIHPEYAGKIISGAKRLEFRRKWPATSVETVFIYATAPIQRIVGYAEVARVTQGTPSQLWRLTRRIQGGITKRKLFTYFNGSKGGVAIELKKVTAVPGGVDPRVCLGRKFRPPQSFKYLSAKQVTRINAYGEN